MEPLVGALRDALQAVRSDGRLPRQVATRLREAARQRNHQQSDLGATEIVNALPAFESLSPHAQRALYDAVLRDDWWSMWLRRAGWRQALVRAARTTARHIPRRFRRLRNLIDQSELVFLIWHARLVHELYKVALAWRGGTAREPTLAAALKMAGLDARVIAASYVRRAPQLPETAAYWHDARRHDTVGVIVGIDFIVNDEGVWFVESNLNVGLTEDRSTLYANDPLVENLVGFARDNGYTSIVYMACNDYSVDQIMAARLQERASRSGLRATILEDRYAPQRQFAQSFLVPSFDGGKTLVVRGKMFHTTLDAMFHHKTLSLEALRSYQRVFADRDLQLPPTGVESIPEPLHTDGPFPNLVYKMPERDQGQGVIFLKVRSMAQARSILADGVAMNRHSVANPWTKLRYQLRLEDQTGIFQSYIPSFLLEGRRLSVARAHVLATPVGLTFLSAHRIVSNIPVPESLAEGIVAEATPYIVNYSLDSEHAPMPPEEERRVSKAALAAVRALCFGVESHFQTRSEQFDHREGSVARDERVDCPVS